jgi:hypothetical protein
VKAMTDLELESALTAYYDRLAPRPSSIAGSAVLGMLAGLVLIMVTIQVSSVPAAQPTHVSLGAASLSSFEDSRP